MKKEQRKKRSATALTPVEAGRFMRRERPDVKQWTCWLALRNRNGYALRSLAGDGLQQRGSFCNGRWSWDRVPCAYSDLNVWSGSADPDSDGVCWFGLVRVTGSQGENFLLFSYLRHDDTVGHEYLTNCTDFSALHAFASDLNGHLKERHKKVKVDSWGGPDIWIDPDADEQVFLPGEMAADIENQAHSFFTGCETFARLNVPYRRGLLFVGQPGTGKTLMTRHLVRRIHAWRDDVSFQLLALKASTDDGDVAMSFRFATKNPPCLLIIEDVDSIARDCRTSKSHFLSQLDGLQTQEGVLVIASTNHPEDLDPALIHRPSRFDRVYHFPLPDRMMRHAYLSATVGSWVGTASVNKLADLTNRWSYAYLKELRTSAAMVALAEGQAEVDESALLVAYDRLAGQFNASVKNDYREPSRAPTGFKAA